MLFIELKSTYSIPTSSSLNSFVLGRYRGGVEVEHRSCAGVPFREGSAVDRHPWKDVFAGMKRIQGVAHALFLFIKRECPTALIPKKDAR